MVGSHRKAARACSRLRTATCPAMFVPYRLAPRIARRCGFRSAAHHVPTHTPRPMSSSLIHSNQGTTQRRGFAVACRPESKIANRGRDVGVTRVARADHSAPQALGRYGRHVLHDRGFIAMIAYHFSNPKIGRPFRSAMRSICLWSKRAYGPLGRPPQPPPFCASSFVTILTPAWISLHIAFKPIGDTDGLGVYVGRLLLPRLQVFRLLSS